MMNTCNIPDCEMKQTFMNVFNFRMARQLSATGETATFCNRRHNFLKATRQLSETEEIFKIGNAHARIAPGKPNTWLFNLVIQPS